ncbi:hypothetical protein L6452_03627 [Arctium lappa]|uniref:Uncharacterized protein n=1 Tax=Arctium lappa TaxID=4217 RepID=A0ACB9FNP8_ARCLA|nr:hypothetical protein L6452_03627 [Arctium lappa]
MFFAPLPWSNFVEGFVPVSVNRSYKVGWSTVNLCCPIKDCVILMECDQILPRQFEMVIRFCFVDWIYVLECDQTLLGGIWIDYSSYWFDVVHSSGFFLLPIFCLLNAIMVFQPLFTIPIFGLFTLYVIWPLAINVFKVDIIGWWSENPLVGSNKVNFWFRWSWQYAIRGMGIFRFYGIVVAHYLLWTDMVFSVTIPSFNTLFFLLNSTVVFQHLLLVFIFGLTLWLPMAIGQIGLFMWLPMWDLLTPTFYIDMFFSTLSLYRWLDWRKPWNGLVLEWDCWIYSFPHQLLSLMILQHLFLFLFFGLFYLWITKMVSQLLFSYLFFGLQLLFSTNYIWWNLEKGAMVQICITSFLPMAYGQFGICLLILLKWVNGEIRSLMVSTVDDRERRNRMKFGENFKNWVQWRSM